MSEHNDLTRWNRAGLSRFRYVDGNAVEYLELLRSRLAEQFADPDSGLCDWLSPPEILPANETGQDSETLIQRQERLSLRQQRVLETYHQDRRDWAWEITRSFARCCHILTEYADAYANEGFLGTATQWEHVRRLVEMLDYHPAPPASAATWLAFIAKEGLSGVVNKGFQIKNSPPTGGDKVIFETLEDLSIDARLNALRPKGWNQSDEAMGDSGDGDSKPGDEQQFSAVALGPAINIQGVGQVQAGKLDTLSASGKLLIKDFSELDPDTVDLDIDATWLWEWKAKADLIVNFAPEGNWTVIFEWLLPEIAKTSAESLADLSGNPVGLAAALKLDIEMIDICLDLPVFEVTPYKDLVTPETVGSDTVKTLWNAVARPDVEPDEVAMLIDAANHRAEAVTVARVEEIDAEPAVFDIDLLISPVQYGWNKWAKGSTRLSYSARWQKKCWLNGSNVVRTVKPHGLTAGAYVGWKASRTGDWQYTKILEADKRDLRLDYAGPMPAKGSELYQLIPIEDTRIDPKFEVIVLLGDEADGGDETDPVKNVAPDIGTKLETDSIFTLTDLAGPSPPSLGLLPPASLPGIGSFLFPSPMLPIDLVKAAVELMLNLGIMQIPSTGEFVIKGIPFGDLLENAPDPGAAANNLYDLLNALTIPVETGTPEKMVEWVDGTNKSESIRKLTDLLTAPSSAETPLFQEIRENLDQKGPLIAISKDASVLATVDANDPLYMFDGTADRVNSGDWVVGRFSDGLRALKVDLIGKYRDEDKNDSFSLDFENLVGSVGELQSVYADFRGELVPAGATLNLSPVDPEDLELEEVPDSLTVCQNVLLTAEGKPPVLAKIVSIDGNRITTLPPATGFKQGELIINGNVVQIGHGESKPEKIIGSGDAAKSNQEFVFEVEAVSFVPDATMSAGVAAALDVVVDGRVWEQVSSLKDSAPYDHHYTIRMTETGFVKIIFGDGKYGRRLPTGKNNIRVRFRVGSGIAGNVASRSLEKPVNPHPLVDGVYQWLPATGGGDMEDQASLKTNAPSTLLALKRAVSLSDFSHLAVAQSSIWQASAYSEILHGGRTENVKVVIVPAGGLSSVETRSELQSFLQQHALPTVQVSVADFAPELFDLTVTIRVDSAAFAPAEIVSAVETRLVDHFKLQNRGLGTDLYLSEVYKVVEAAEGVENSICVINDDEQLKVIKANDESTVIYFDTDSTSTLTVVAEEYQP